MSKTPYRTLDRDAPRAERKGTHFMVVFLMLLLFVMVAYAQRQGR